MCRKKWHCRMTCRTSNKIFISLRKRISNIFYDTCSKILHCQTTRRSNNFHTSCSKTLHCRTTGTSTKWYAKKLRRWSSGALSHDYPTNSVSAVTPISWLLYRSHTEQLTFTGMSITRITTQANAIPSDTFCICITGRAYVVCIYKIKILFL